MRKVAPLILGLCLSGLASGRCADESSKLITPEEVAAYRAQHEKDWLAKTTLGQPRLFYDKDSWSAMAERVRKLGGAGARWRKFADETAQAIIKQPLPVYRPPEAFVGEGNSILQAREELWQRAVGNNIAFLAFMARLDDRPEYRAYLRELVLSALKLDSWGVGIWRDCDLAAAHILRGVAMAWDWHRDIFSAEDQAFIRETIARRTPTMLGGLYGKIFWGREYRANHNHISVAALGLTGLAFLNDLPQAADWLAASMLDYERVAADMNHDGSSEEGLGYASYGMNFILQFIEGVRLVTDSAKFYDSPFLQHAANYRIGSSTPGLEGVLLWGDATGKDYYGPQQILCRLASQYDDGGAQFLAESLSFLPRGAGPEGNANDVLAFALLWNDPAVTARAPEQLDYRYKDWEVLTSRNSWKNDAYLFTLKAGLNNLHHSHLDAGAIAFNLGGSWLLTAPGYGDHGAPGFWDREGKRWTFFSNATESHSTLLINGQNQRFDREAGASILSMVSASQSMFASVDMTRAYDGVKRVTRRVFHQRGEYILVLDDLEGTESLRAEWLAQVPPRAMVQDDGDIVVTANSTASMRLRLFGGAPGFTDRAPTVEHFNLPASKLKTLSSAQEGRQVRFAAIIRPFVAGSTYESWKTELTGDTGKSVVTISGSGWVDTVESFADPGTTGRLGDKDVGGEANVLSVRRQAGEIGGVILAGAREYSAPAWGFTSQTPVDVIEALAADGNRSVRLAQELKGSIRIDASFELLDEKGRALDGGDSVTLSPGAYILRKRTSGAGPS